MKLINAFNALCTSPYHVPLGIALIVLFIAFEWRAATRRRERKQPLLASGDCSALNRPD